MNTKITLPNLYILCFLLISLVPLSLQAGNKELMRKKRLKTLLLNETILKQIGEINHDGTFSFLGRVKKNPDGSFEIMVDQIEKRAIDPVQIRSKGSHYIEYMSFEDMQKQVGKKQPEKPAYFGGGVAR